MSLVHNRTGALAQSLGVSGGTQRLQADDRVVVEGLAARPVLVTRNFLAHPTSLNQPNRNAYQEQSPARNAGQQQGLAQGQAQQFDSPSSGFGRTQNPYQQQQSPLRSLQPSPSEARFRSPQQMGAGATLSPVNNRSGGLNHSRSEGGLLHSPQRLMQQQQQQQSPQGYGAAAGQRPPPTGMLPQLHSPNRLATGAGVGAGAGSHSNVGSPLAAQQAQQATHASRHSTQIQYVHSEPSERSHPGGDQAQEEGQGQGQAQDQEWQKRVQQQLEQQQWEQQQQQGHEHEHDQGHGADGAAEGGPTGPFDDDAAQAAYEAEQALRAEQEQEHYHQQQQGHGHGQDQYGQGHAGEHGREMGDAQGEQEYYREQEEYRQFLQWKASQQGGQGQGQGQQQQQQQYGHPHPSQAQDPNPYARSSVRQLSVVSRPGTQSRAQAHTFLAWSPGAARLGRRNPINRSSDNPLWHEGQTSSESFLKSHSQQSFNAGGWQPRPSPVAEASVFRSNTESRDNFKPPPSRMDYASRVREAELAKQKAEAAHYSPILGNLVGRPTQHQQQQGQQQGQQGQYAQHASPTKFPTLHLRP